MQIIEKQSKVDEIINAYNSGNNIPSIYQDVDFPKYLDEEPKKTLLNFWAETPIPKAYEEKLPITSSFLTSFDSLFTIDFFSNPTGIVCKVFSLLIQPLIFGIGTYLFFSVFMWRERYLALIPALYLYFLTLSQCVRCLGFRPTPRETIGLFCHQIALIWLSWTLGSMSYCVGQAQFSNTEEEATLVGLVVAWYVYAYCLPYVSEKVGASNLFTYLTQVIKVFLGTVVSVIVGYLLSTFIWNWFFEPKIDLLDFNFFTDSNHLRMHAIAMFFGFVGFWVSVNLYYGTVIKSKRPEERGDEVFEI
jgi:hypothetical protein